MKKLFKVKNKINLDIYPNCKYNIFSGIEKSVVEKKAVYGLKE